MAKKPANSGAVNQHKAMAMGKDAPSPSRATPFKKGGKIGKGKDKDKC